MTFSSDSAAPPDSASAHIKRAQDQLRARDHAGAREAAMTALALPPGDIVARNALGSVLYELGDLDAARALFQGVLADNPHYADALNNLGNILVRDRKPRAAIEFYERALAVSPERADYLANLGGARQALNDVAGALACFDRALAVAPDHADARWNRGLARLLTGDLAGGFADYEARWLLPEFAARRFASPPWQGEDIAGRTILIHSEQGYGDTIQMIRFAGGLSRRGARVLLETHAPLVPLMRAVAGIDRVIERGGALPPFDVHVPVMSLPRLCGVAALADIPAAGPYIHAAPKVLPGHSRPSGRGLSIGLVWAGRPTHKNDRNRSLPAAMLRPLMAVPDARFYGLQPDVRTDDLAELPGLVDLGPQLTDFAATAGFVAALDLVITVDTAVAHLAGVMGKPAWVMLPFAPDWRWLLDRADSPWYPSLSLFRQARLGDWAGPVAQIAAALAGFRPA